jgi:hypothetical protein
MCPEHLLLVRAGEKLGLQNAMHTTLGLSALGSFSVCLVTSCGAKELDVNRLILNLSSDDWSGGLVPGGQGGRGFWVQPYNAAGVNAAALDLTFLRHRQPSLDRDRGQL